MTHMRQIIRDTIVARLQHGVPPLAGRVFANRSRPTDPGELPVALVYALSERSQAATIKGALLRNLTVVVEIRARLSDGSDDFLDDLCRAVEIAIALDPRVGGAALYSELSSTAIGLDGEGETRQMIASLSYSVQYQTDPAGT